MTALEIDGLSKFYGELRALNDVTFEVPAGELFGFVGSNGAGKTTTMRIILGVLRADAGVVRWGGEGAATSRRRPRPRGGVPSTVLARWGYQVSSPPTRGCSGD